MDSLRVPFSTVKSPWSPCSADEVQEKKVLNYGGKPELKEKRKKGKYPGLALASLRLLRTRRRKRQKEGKKSNIRRKAAVAHSSAKVKYSSPNFVD